MRRLGLAHPAQAFASASAFQRRVAKNRPAPAAAAAPKRGEAELLLVGADPQLRAVIHRLGVEAAVGAMIAGYRLEQIVLAVGADRLGSCWLLKPVRAR